MPKVDTLLQDAQKLSDAEKVQFVGEIVSGGGILWLSKALGALETKLGVKAAVSAVTPGGPSSEKGAKSQAEAPTAFDVILKSVGPNKINVIKAVRAATSLGLKEAKDLVEKGGEAVKKGLEKPEAEKLAKELRDAGAEADVKPTG